MSNTRIWEVLGKTDPKHTKYFKRSGGFSGTAIKPMWANQRMTEFFGPCGTGWGSTEPQFQIVPADKEIMVYCTVGLWYLEAGSAARSEIVYGVGGDKVLKSQTSGLRADDEAFKMAYTDALGNAMKFIGVAADIHMGMFDDSKYRDEMAAEFKASEKPTVVQRKSEAIKQDPEKMQRDRLAKILSVFTPEQKATFGEQMKKLEMTSLKSIPTPMLDDVIAYAEGI